MEWLSDEVRTGLTSWVLRKGEVGLTDRTGGVGLAVEDEVGGERPTGEGFNPEEEEEGLQTGSAAWVGSEGPTKGSTDDRLATFLVGERGKEQAGERERGGLLLLIIIIISRGRSRPTRGGAGETTVRRRSS